MNLTNIIKGGMVAGALTLSAVGCGNEPTYIEGIVIEEFGNAPGISESSGAIFGNESVKLSGKDYGIRVETNKGIYTIDLSDDQIGPIGPKTVLNLSNAIVPYETRVKFPIANFTNDRIGQLDPDEIEVLN